MSKKDSVLRQNVIVKFLESRKRATFEDILNHLERESAYQDANFNIGKRTFQRDCEDIRSLFNVDIRYDFSQKYYYINGEMKPKNQRILEAFSLYKIQTISDEFSDFVYFENRKSSGLEHFHGLVHAIQNKFFVRFFYQKFWDDEQSERAVEPYGLKEFKNRWYLIAIDLKDQKLKSFGLDRIYDLDITKSIFKHRERVNINQYFKHSFGVIDGGEESPEKVVLSFTPDQGKYVKTLPLHPSQHIIEENEKELIIGLNIHVTFDFIMEIMSMGSNVKVISPISFVEELKGKFREALERYVGVYNKY